MRLDAVDHGHSPREAAILAEIAQARGVPTASGVLKTLYYRPEIFGRPFSAALDVAMRGESDWTAAERELFAGYVSALNQCPF
jgi:hypothetical protein